MAAVCHSSATQHRRPRLGRPHGAWPLRCITAATQEPSGNCGQRYAVLLRPVQPTTRASCLDHMRCVRRLDFDSPACFTPCHDALCYGKPSNCSVANQAGLRTCAVMCNNNTPRQSCLAQTGPSSVTVSARIDCPVGHRVHGGPLNHAGVDDMAREQEESQGTLSLVDHRRRLRRSTRARPVDT